MSESVIHKAIHVEAAKPPRLFSTSQQKELEGLPSHLFGSAARSWKLLPGLYIQVGYLPKYPSPNPIRSTKIMLVHVSRELRVTTCRPAYLSRWLVTLLGWPEQSMQVWSDDTQTLRSCRRNRVLTRVS